MSEIKILPLSQIDILNYVKGGSLPSAVQGRLQASRDGTQPWVATLTPAELLIARSHGIRPIAAVSSTCWLHYGWSWTEGHAQGWNMALHRLRDEAKAAGANAVVDVKMRTVPLTVADSMDFSLIGTAVRVEGLPPSSDPVVSTVSALEFAKLLDADIVPTGIAVGAAYEWISDGQNKANLLWAGNIENVTLSRLWEHVRQEAHGQLRQQAGTLGNGALAHIDFSQMFKRLVDKQPTQYLARHIVIATTVDIPAVSRQAAMAALPDFRMVVDLHAGATPLTGVTHSHQSYGTRDIESAI